MGAGHVMHPVSNLFLVRHIANLVSKSDAPGLPCLSVFFFEAEVLPTKGVHYSDWHRSPEAFVRACMHVGGPAINVFSISCHTCCKPQAHFRPVCVAV